MTRGFTKHTVETYVSDVNNFLEFFNYDLHTDMKSLMRYLTHLRARNLADSTLNGYFAAISTFFDYLVWCDTIESNPVPIFRRRYLRFKRKYNTKNTRQLISIPKMAELVYTPFAYEHTKIRENLWSVPIRDHLIMMILAKTGIRRGELYAIDLSDIDPVMGEIYLNEFHKRTNCLVFLDAECIGALHEYLAWRAKAVQCSHTMLLLSHTGHKLRKDDIYYIVTFYALQIGIHNPNGQLKDKFTPHCFRHWFTTHLRRGGMCREYRMWLRGDAPKGADDLYDHIDPVEVLEDYLIRIPELDYIINDALNP